MEKYSVRKFIISGMVIFLLVASFQSVISANIGFNDESDYKIVNKMGDPPEWADGEFNGTYGKIILGKRSVELGWAEGYWSSDPIGFSLFEKGRIECYFGEWEDEEPISIMKTNLISYFTYPYFQSVLIGTITDITTDNEKFCICFGRIGIDGTLNYNSLVITGDNIYFTGNYSEFEE